MTFSISEQRFLVRLYELMKNEFDFGFFIEFYTQKEFTINGTNYLKVTRRMLAKEFIWKNPKGKGFRLTRDGWKIAELIKKT